MCTTLCLLISKTCLTDITLFFPGIENQPASSTCYCLQVHPSKPQSITGRASLKPESTGVTTQSYCTKCIWLSACQSCVNLLVLSYTCNRLDVGATGKTLLNQFSNFLLLTFSGDKRCTYIFLLGIMLSEHFSVIALILHWRTASDAEGNVNTEDFKGCIVSWCKTFLKKESIPFFMIQQAWTEILSY